MGADRSLPLAFAKACMGAGVVLPTEGTVFLSVRDQDKDAAVEIARSLRSMGFRVVSTGGTYAHLREFGIEWNLPKISRACSNINDLLADGGSLILNTATRKRADTDEGRIRATAVGRACDDHDRAGGRAAVQAIAALRAGEWNVAATGLLPELARPPWNRPPRGFDRLPG